MDPIYPPGFEPSSLLQNISFFPLYGASESIWRDSNEKAFHAPVSVMRQMLRLHRATEDTSFFIHTVNKKLHVQKYPEATISLDKTQSQPHRRLTDDDENCVGGLYRNVRPILEQRDEERLIPSDIQALIGSKSLQSTPKGHKSTPIVLPDGSWEDKVDLTSALDMLMESAGRFKSKNSTEPKETRLGPFRMTLHDDTGLVALHRAPADIRPDPILVVRTLQKSAPHVLFDTWLDALLLGAENLAIGVYEGPTAVSASLTHRDAILSNEAFMADLHQGIELLNFLATVCSTDKTSYWLYKNKAADQAMIVNLGTSPEDGGNNALILGSHCLKFAAQLALSDPTSENIQAEFLMRGLQMITNLGGSRARQVRLALRSQQIELEMKQLNQNIHTRPIDQFETTARKLRDMMGLLKGPWITWAAKASLTLADIGDKIRDDLRRTELHQLLASVLTTRTKWDTFVQQALEVFAVSRQKSLQNILTAAHKALSLASGQAAIRSEAHQALLKASLHYGFFSISAKDASGRFPSVSSKSVSDLVHEYFSEIPAFDRHKVASQFDRIDAVSASLLGQSEVPQVADIDRLWIEASVKVLEELNYEIRSHLATLHHELSFQRLKGADVTRDPLMYDNDWSRAERCLLILSRLVLAIFLDSQSPSRVAVMLLTLAKSIQLCSSNGRVSLDRNYFSDVQYMCYTMALKCSDLAHKLTSKKSSEAPPDTLKRLLEHQLSPNPAPPVELPSSMSMSLYDAQVQENLRYISEVRAAYTQLAVGVDLNQYLSYQADIVRRGKTKTRRMFTNISHSSEVSEWAQEMAKSLSADSSATSPATSPVMSLLRPLLPTALDLVRNADRHFIDSNQPCPDFGPMASAFETWLISHEGVFTDDLGRLALNHLDDALSAFEKTGIRKESAVCHYYAGHIYSKTDKSRGLALKHLRAALEEFDPRIYATDFLNTAILIVKVEESRSPLVALAAGLAAEITLSHTPLEWRQSLREIVQRLVRVMLKGWKEQSRPCELKKSRFNDLCQKCESLVRAMSVTAMKSLYMTLLKCPSIPSVQMLN